MIGPPEWIRSWGPVRKAIHATRRWRRSPFTGKPRLIIHSCYHKVGTVWFLRVLGTIAADCGLPFTNADEEPHGHRYGVIVDPHSRTDLASLPPYVGSHMIRDPRDVVISGYFYHLWTREPWAHVPKAEYGGRTYQEHLKGLHVDDGLKAEIERTAPNIVEMVSWNYDNPNVLELRYEDLKRDEEGQFRRLFDHYGFSQEAIESSLEVVERFSFKRVASRSPNETGTGTHLRSGKPGEWAEHFTEDHKQYFKRLLGDAVVQLGYEETNDW